MVRHLYYTLHGGLFLRAQGFCPKHEAMPGREDRLLVAGAIEEHVQSIPMEFRVREWQPRHGLLIQKEMLPSCLYHDVSFLPLHRTTALPLHHLFFSASPLHRSFHPSLPAAGHDDGFHVMAPSEQQQIMLPFFGCAAFLMVASFAPLTNCVRKRHYMWLMNSSTVIPCITDQISQGASFHVPAPVNRN